MTELEISVFNLKLAHQQRIENLKEKIKELQEEICLLKESYGRIYDL